MSRSAALGQPNCAPSRRKKLRRPNQKKRGKSVKRKGKKAFSNTLRLGAQSPKPYPLRKLREEGYWHRYRRNREKRGSSFAGGTGIIADEGRRSFYIKKNSERTRKESLIKGGERKTSAILKRISFIRRGGNGGRKAGLSIGEKIEKPSRGKNF